MKKWRPKVAWATWKRRPSHATTRASRAHTYPAGRLGGRRGHPGDGRGAKRRSARNSWVLETSPSRVQKPSHFRRVRMTPNIKASREDVEGKRRGEALRLPSTSFLDASPRRLGRYVFRASFDLRMPYPK